MNEVIQIWLAAILFAGIGYPLVTLFDKWKKEMDKDGENKE